MKIVSAEKSVLFKKYDLIGQNQRILEKDNRVESIMRLLSAQFDNTLSEYFQREISVSTDHITFEEIKNLGDEQVRTKFDVLGKVGNDNSRLVGIKLSRKIVYRLVDIIFGGSGYVSEISEEIPVADSEEYVKEKIIEILVNSILEILRRRCDSEEPWVTFDDLEEATQQLNVNMVCVPIEVKIGETSDQGEIWLATEILEQLAGVNLNENLSDNGPVITPEEILQTHLIPCEVEVTCQLPDRSIEFQDALSLKEGDLIAVGSLEKATLSIEDTELLSVQMGVLDGNISAKVISWI